MQQSEEDERTNRIWANLRTLMCVCDLSLGPGLVLFTPDHADSSSIESKAQNNTILP